MSTVTKFSRNLLIASSLLLCAQARAQTLVYALSYEETTASFRTRFPHGAIGATRDEQLAMLRGYRKTEIYSVSMIDGKRSLLFSDEGMNFDVTPTGAMLGAGKAYAKGVVREWHTTPNTGVDSNLPAIYEISLDGSKRFRRLFEFQPDQTPTLLNPQATRAVFGTFVNEEFVVFIYDVPAWKLLRRWKLTNLTKAHCPDCIPTSLGWLADGNRLFVNLDVSGDYDEEKNHDIAGTYLLAEDGIDLGGMPRHAGELQLPGYVREQEVIPYLIGQLPDGDYLFRDYGIKKVPLPKARREFESFLIITGPDFKSKRQIPLNKLGLGYFYLSPTGKYLASVEDRQIPNYRTERHLWGFDLESGAEKELLVTPPANPPTSPEPNVILTVLGWVDSK